MAIILWESMTQSTDLQDLHFHQFIVFCPPRILQKLLLVTAMKDLPCVSRYEASIRFKHSITVSFNVTAFLNVSFWCQNGVFKLHIEGIEKLKCFFVKDLLRSVPNTNGAESKTVTDICRKCFAAPPRTMSRLGKLR